MAIAAEALEGAAGEATEGAETAVGTPRPINVRLPSVRAASGGRGGAGVGVRLIWATAAALIVLELLSLATGRYWSWNLKGGLSSLRNAGSYLGLYPGQTTKLAQQSAAAGQDALTFTGAVTTQGPATNLSGRAGGNLAGP